MKRVNFHPVVGKAFFRCDGLSMKILAIGAALMLGAALTPSARAMAVHTLGSIVQSSDPGTLFAVVNSNPAGSGVLGQAGVVPFSNDFRRRPHRHFESFGRFRRLRAGRIGGERLRCCRRIIRIKPRPVRHQLRDSGGSCNPSGFR